MKKLLLLLLLAIPGAVFAASAGPTYPNDPANIDVSDKKSLQNGAKLFINYCAGCHSMEYVRYSRIAQDLGLTEEQTVQNLILGNKKFGDTLKKSMKPELAKKWFGVDPLDLSLVARVRGEDWLYNYLRAFYKDETRPFGVNNTVFPGVGMPHIFADLQGVQVLSEEWISAESAITNAKNIIANKESSAAEKSQALKDEKAALAIKKQLSADGEVFTHLSGGSMTKEGYDNQMRDLVAFMAYTANPVQLKSKSMGVWALLFLVLLLIPAYFLKKEFWKDVH